jgi:hypothetical protein
MQATIFDRLRSGLTNLGPESHLRVPTISLELNGVLANHFAAVLTIGYQNTNRFFDWRSLRGNERESGEPFSPCRFTLDDMDCFKRRAAETPDFWVDLPPFSRQDMELVGEVCESGAVAIFFVSDRRDCAGQSPLLADARMQSLAWLNKYGIHNYMGTDFACGNKLATLRLHAVEYHLDDDPHEVVQLRAAGIQAFLLTRPWNEDVRSPFRVDSVSDYLDAVSGNGVARKGPGSEGLDAAPPIGAAALH